MTVTLGGVRTKESGFVFLFSHLKTIVLFHVLIISFPRLEDDPPDTPKLSPLTLNGTFPRGDSGRKTIKFVYIFIGSEQAKDSGSARFIRVAALFFGPRGTGGGGVSDARS